MFAECVIPSRQVPPDHRNQGGRGAGNKASAKPANSPCACMRSADRIVVLIIRGSLKGRSNTVYIHCQRQLRSFSYTGPAAAAGKMSKAHPKKPRPKISLMLVAAQYEYSIVRFSLVLYKPQDALQAQAFSAVTCQGGSRIALHGDTKGGIRQCMWCTAAACYLHQLRIWHGC